VLEDSLDKTWIVNAQSPAQKEIIASLNEELYVEGPFFCLFRGTMVSYFVLRTAPPKQVVKPTEDEDPFDVSNLKFNMFGGVNRAKALTRTHEMHKQSDGTIVALCCTGTSSRDSLLSWIRILEHLDPNLKKIKVIFKLKAPATGELVVQTNQSSPSPLFNSDTAPNTESRTNPS
jgi:signaling intermediate in Toll pathway protein